MRNWMSVAWAAVLLAAAGEAKFNGQATGIDAIEAYKGTWKMEVERFDTAYSKAGKESSTLRDDCWKSSGFYVCNQIVNGESKALIVFTYNDKDKTYTTYPIPTDGGAPASGKLLINGNVWIYPWENTEKGKTTYFRVVNTFTAPNRIEYRQEFSTNKQNWTLMARGTEVKK